MYMGVVGILYGTLRDVVYCMVKLLHDYEVYRLELLRFREIPPLVKLFDVSFELRGVIAKAPC